MTTMNMIRTFSMSLRDDFGTITWRSSTDPFRTLELSNMERINVIRVQAITDTCNSSAMLIQ